MEWKTSGGLHFFLNSYKINASLSNTLLRNCVLLARASAVGIPVYGYLFTLLRNIVCRRKIFKRVVGQDKQTEEIGLRLHYLVPQYRVQLIIIYLDRSRIIKKSLPI